MSPGCLVLCYHAISDTWNDPLATSAQVLERQLKMLLRRGYTPVDGEGALANRARTLHVTFDDAFRSVDSVLGVLERLGVPATIFACTKLAERGDPFRVPEMSGRLPADEDELLTMSWDTLGGLAERGVQVGSHTPPRTRTCRGSVTTICRRRSCRRANSSRHGSAGPVGFSPTPMAITMPVYRPLHNAPATPARSLWNRPPAPSPHMRSLESGCTAVTTPSGSC